MANIAGVSEEDMVVFMQLLEKAGMDAQAVSDVLARRKSVPHELNRFLLRLRRSRTDDEVQDEVLSGTWRDWPGITG